MKKIAILFLLLFSQLFASHQSTNTVETKDTVIIGGYQMNPIVIGDSIKIPLYLWNSEYLQAFNLPIRLVGTNVKFNSIVWDTTVPGMSKWVFKNVFVVPLESDSSTIDSTWYNIGAIDFTGVSPIPPATVPYHIADIVIKILQGCESQYIEIDSTFIKPAAYFTLVASYAGICPVLKRGDIALPVEDVSITIPNNYMYQNYPNPFNPTTSIRFCLQKQESVKIQVFNILGQTIFSVNKWFNSGLNSVEWDATDEPSGVYFYRVSTSTFTDTKKMVLLK
jgi:hypothetical protein